MSKRIHIKEPSADVMQIIWRSMLAISEQKPRIIKCHYCHHTAIVVFDDTRGHIQSKCKLCGKENIFEVV